MDFRKKFGVQPGTKFKLTDIDPAYKGEHESDQGANLPFALMRVTSKRARDKRTRVQIRPKDAIEREQSDGKRNISKMAERARVPLRSTGASAAARRSGHGDRAS